MRRTYCLALMLAVSGAVGCRESSDKILGHWFAYLDSPGGRLEFELEVRRPQGGDESLQVAIFNGAERIEVRDASLEGDRLALRFPHYDSELTARWDGGQSLDGEWVKQSRNGANRLAFHAVREAPPRSSGAAAGRLAGRWAVTFSSTPDPAVGEFATTRDGRFIGTFLTSTGDYRYMQGAVSGGTMRLSCFDGAHAFLVRATLQNDDSLQGDFWSSDTWHETWTAARDSAAQPPDPLLQTSWNDRIELTDIVVRDLRGETRKLDLAAAGGGPYLVYLFGSWCPNCHDAAAFLSQVQRRYADQGLRIVGLAFEHSSDWRPAIAQVQTYAARHDVRYPLYLCGSSDKKLASEAFPALDRVRAYPTFLFVDRGGRVRAIYTGFNGPATGEEHLRLQITFDRLITALLDGEAATATAASAEDAAPTP